MLYDQKSYFWYKQRATFLEFTFQTKREETQTFLYEKVGGGGPIAKIWKDLSHKKTLYISMDAGIKRSGRALSI